MSEEQWKSKVEGWYEDATLFLVGVAMGGMTVQLFKLIKLIIRGVRWVS